ncbi:hypothetical protein [Halomontanus rarus]|uniref:hypothetical protein n=1 Tax=Halomontanus rarus TaxID=3034020 RepID=UPI001A9842AB
MATSQCAAAVGLDTPSDYTPLVQELDEAGRPVDRLSELDFPLFLKPRWETGGGHTATSSVENPTRFWETHDRVAKGAPGGDVLVQEKIDGSRATYGCGLLFFDDKLDLLFSHEERRSVPRRGGSGTHLRIVRDPHLEAKSIELLREIDWHGLALVEFKKRTDGSYVLMEINPKFWASYALASTHGYRFASTMVARSLGLETEPPIGSPVPVGEMVFPLRELHFYAQHYREESLRECLATILQPGVSWSVDRTDLLAWLTPPASVIQKLPTVDEPSNGETVPKPLSDDLVDETNEVETGDTS